MCQRNRCSQWQQRKQDKQSRAQGILRNTPRDTAGSSTEGLSALASSRNTPSPLCPPPPALALRPRSLGALLPSPTSQPSTPGLRDPPAHLPPTLTPELPGSPAALLAPESGVCPAPEPTAPAAAVGTENVSPSHPWPRHPCERCFLKGVNTTGKEDSGTQTHLVWNFHGQTPLLLRK